MLELHCKGSPYEVGYRHGQLAKAQVHGSLDFYKALFLQTAKLDWKKVCEVATKFNSFLEKNFPLLVEEIKGVADGAGVDFDSILALNVRTEIAYGMATDGCTAFSWKSKNQSFHAQTWDVSLVYHLASTLQNGASPSNVLTRLIEKQWQGEQKANLISIYISQSMRPAIHMITEAGIIGKIGLNSSGVGVTLNALKSPGVSFNKIPCHLALRTALDSTSRADAVAKLASYGVASACHILVSDATGGVGNECTAYDIASIPMNEQGQVTHTNHYLVPHQGPFGLLECDLSVMKATEFRLERIRELLAQAEGEPDEKMLMGFLQDEKNYPDCICLAASGGSSAATLFGIVMDLRNKKAVVRLGRPIDPDGVYQLAP